MEPAFGFLGANAKRVIMLLSEERWGEERERWGEGLWLCKAWLLLWEVLEPLEAEQSHAWFHSWPRFHRTLGCWVAEGLQAVRVGLQAVRVEVGRLVRRWLNGLKES